MGRAYGAILIAVGYLWCNSGMQESMNPEVVVDNTGVVDLTRILSTEDDSFAMAVVEFGGNLRAAYQSVFGEDPYATARAKGLMARPEVAARVHELQHTIKDSQLISIESHMVELASIRDLAKTMGAIKVALGAEELRGKVAGLYVGTSDAPVKVDPNHLEDLATRLVGLQRRVVSKGAEDVEVKTVEVHPST